jgi:hypothetical protein
MYIDGYKPLHFYMMLRGSGEGAVGAKRVPKKHEQNILSTRDSPTCLWHQPHDTGHHTRSYT